MADVFWSKKQLRHFLDEIIKENLKNAEESSAICSDNFIVERQIYNKTAIDGSRKFYVAGTDEAGRGPLAGPVVAAAVILPYNCKSSLFIDSKKLTATKRKALYHKLQQIGTIFGIGIASVEEIDTINILQASLLAMKRAVLQLSPLPHFLLVDGKFTVSFDQTTEKETSEKRTDKKTLPIFQHALIKGESKSASIAAASIIAKVTRDQMMAKIDQKHPHYGFAQHKGYPTKVHRTAIARYGICTEHRRTFRGVREFV